MKKTFFRLGILDPGPSEFRKRKKLETLRQKQQSAAADGAEKKQEPQVKEPVPAEKMAEAQLPATEIMADAGSADVQETFPEPAFTEENTAPPEPPVTQETEKQPETVPEMQSVEETEEAAVIQEMAEIPAEQEAVPEEDATESIQETGDFPETENEGNVREKQEEPVAETAMENPVAEIIPEEPKEPVQGMGVPDTVQEEIPAATAVENQETVDEETMSEDMSSDELDFSSMFGGIPDDSFETGSQDIPVIEETAVTEDTPGNIPAERAEGQGTVEQLPEESSPTPVEEKTPSTDELMEQIRKLEAIKKQLEEQMAAKEAAHAAVQPPVAEQSGEPAEVKVPEPAAAETPVLTPEPAVEADATAAVTTAETQEDDGNLFEVPPEDGGNGYDDMFEIPEAKATDGEPTATEKQAESEPAEPEMDIPELSVTAYGKGEATEPEPAATPVPEKSESEDPSVNVITLADEKKEEPEKTQEIPEAPEPEIIVPTVNVIKLGEGGDPEGKPEVSVLNVIETGGQKTEEPGGAVEKIPDPVPGNATVTAGSVNVVKLDGEGPKNPAEKKEEKHPNEVPRDELFKQIETPHKVESSGVKPEKFTFASLRDYLHTNFGI